MVPVAGTMSYIPDHRLQPELLEKFKPSTLNRNQRGHLTLHPWIICCSLAGGDSGSGMDGQEYKRSFKKFNYLGWETDRCTWITERIIQHPEASYTHTKCRSLDKRIVNGGWSGQEKLHPQEGTRVGPWKKYRFSKEKQSVVFSLSLLRSVREMQKAFLFLQKEFGIKGRNFKFNTHNFCCLKITSCFSWVLTTIDVFP